MVILTIFAIFSVLFNVFGATAQLCPTLPRPLPPPMDLPIIDALPNPWKFFNNASLHSPADWRCRKAELMTLVQEYMYGYYPDHSLERVRATRNGSSITINVSVGHKSTSFGATLTLPTSINATRRHPVPVVINTDPVNNTVFLGSGAVVS